MPEELCNCEGPPEERLWSRSLTDLPSHIVIHECEECGMWAEYDTELNEYRSTV